MNCLKCNIEVPDGSAFCHNCGAPIGPLAPSPGPQPPARRALPLGAGAGGLALAAAAIAVVLLVVQPFGDGDGEDQIVEAKDVDPALLVLAEADVPGGFELTEEERSDNEAEAADACDPEEALRRYDVLGRIEGYDRSFRHRAGDEVMSSSAVVYTTIDAAQDAFNEPFDVEEEELRCAARAEGLRVEDFRAIGGPAVGQEAEWTYIRVAGLLGVQAEITSVVFRRANVVAGIAWASFTGVPSAEDVERLAHRQDEIIKTALAVASPFGDSLGAIETPTPTTPAVAPTLGVPAEPSTNPLTVLDPPPAPDLGDIEVAPKEGSLAPDFEISDFDGSRHRLSDFRGGPVYVNFWATWCIPCQRELPDIQALLDRHPGKLAVITVNRAEPLDRAESFFANIERLNGEPGVSFTVDGLDPDDTLYNEYRGLDMPVSVFIDAGGKVVKLFNGLIDLEIMEAAYQETVSPSAESEIEFDVSMGDNFFSPSRLSVEAGQRFRINVTNDGEFPHNLRIAGPDDTYDTADDLTSTPSVQRGGETGELVAQINEPGVYIFRCDFHPLEQTGTIVVR